MANRLASRVVPRAYRSTIHVVLGDEAVFWPHLHHLIRIEKLKKKKIIKKSKFFFKLIKIKIYESENWLEERETAEIIDRRWFDGKNGYERHQECVSVGQSNRLA